MPTNQIGSEVVQFWDGDPPQFLAQHVEQFSRAGADGLGHRLTGTRGNSFKARLTAHAVNYATARALINNYLALIGTVVSITHEGVDLDSTFGCKFVVEDVREVSCLAHVRLIGPGYNYSSGASIVTEWTLAAIDSALV